MDVRRGTLQINQGTMKLDSILVLGVPTGGSLVSNLGASGVINFNSGLISAVSADINNGSMMMLGDGSMTGATYRMTKDALGVAGTHSFANGLLLNSNATLEGDGNIVGNVFGAEGAQVDIGQSPGIISVTGDFDNTIIHD